MMTVGKICYTKKLLLVLVALFLFPGFTVAAITASDLNQNNINDAEEEEVIVVESTSLPSGEYNFNNLTINEGVVLILQGDSLGNDLFKGVKISAQNITNNGIISADKQGYGGGGPGSPLPETEQASGAYGGTTLGNTEDAIYGSALFPKELGSGINDSDDYRAGGAIWLDIQNTLVNNGEISSSGYYKYRASGGSVYIDTSVLEGDGVIKANGGGTKHPNRYSGAGGRVAVYYDTSSYEGSVEAAAGVYCFYGCNKAAEDGTAIMVDKATNDYYIQNSFRFQKNELLENVNNMYIQGATIAEKGVTIEARNIYIQDLLTLEESVTIKANTLYVQDSLMLNSSTVLEVENIEIQEGGVLTVEEENILTIQAESINIHSGGSINLDQKGHKFMEGLGAPKDPDSGASHGGDGLGDSISGVYGEAFHPDALGSGGGYGGDDQRGGGAVHIISDILTNNGNISTSGGYTASGGSIWIEVGEIHGNGTIKSDGGRYSNHMSLSPHRPGAGGRVAVYYDTSSYEGEVTVEGGEYCSSGCNDKAGDGTATMIDVSNNDIYIKGSFRFEDTASDFNNIYVGENAVLSIEEGVSVKAKTLYVGEGGTVYFPEFFDLDLQNLEVGTGSVVTTRNPGYPLSLKIPSINIQGGYIQVDNKGHCDHIPVVEPDYTYFGGSYGGIGFGGDGSSVYGDLNEPVDLGSAGSYTKACGGGALYIEADVLSNNGYIEANGVNSASGGSVYVRAKELSGSGVFSAEGGRRSHSSRKDYGGGGRVAVYYETDSFTGSTSADGGNSKGEDDEGTVIYEEGEFACVPGEDTDCNSSVMFLPGFEGSRLYNKDGDELWVSTKNSYHDQLFMDDYGNSIHSDIHTINDTKRLDGDGKELGLADKILVVNIYRTFIESLQSWKDKDGMIEDYAFIPYDWRLSLEDVVTNGKVGINNELSYLQEQDFSESFILQKLQQLQASSRTGKVTIVAHSNGGLVAKALVQKLKDTNNPLYEKIDKIILVATPQVGTPDALVALLHGLKIGKGILLPKDEVRALVEDMPGFYNLLPSEVYFDVVDIDQNPIASFEDSEELQNQINEYGVTVDSYEEMKDYILGTDGRDKPEYSDIMNPSIGNSNVYDLAEGVHGALDNWQPYSGTEFIQVAGWGEETTSGIKYKTYTNFLGKKYISYKPVKVIDGDSTVVVPSALWVSDDNQNVERWWVNLFLYNDKRFIGKDHKDIFEVSDLLDFLKYKILNKKSFLNKENIIIPYNDIGLYSTEGRLHFTLHSPLYLGIRDAGGRYTGIDPDTGELREEVPGARYEQFGGVQFISVPKGVEYTLVLNGYEAGSFALDIDEQIGNDIVRFVSFQGVPVEIGANAEIKISTDFEINSSRLEIDIDGDSEIDSVLEGKDGGVILYESPVVEEVSALNAPAGVVNIFADFNVATVSEPEPETIKGLEPKTESQPEDVEEEEQKSEQNESVFSASYEEFDQEENIEEKSSTKEASNEEVQGLSETEETQEEVVETLSTENYTQDKNITLVASVSNTEFDFDYKALFFISVLLLLIALGFKLNKG